LNLDDDVVDAM